MQTFFNVAKVEGTFAAVMSEVDSEHRLFEYLREELNKSFLGRRCLLETWPGQTNESRRVAGFSKHFRHGLCRLDRHVWDANIAECQGICVACTRRGRPVSVYD